MSATPQATTTSLIPPKLLDKVLEKPQFSLGCLISVVML